MTPPTVLHYLGYDNDTGGIVSVVRALAAANQFPCVLGVNEGFVQRRVPALAVHTFPVVQGETIGPGNLWRTRRVARQLRAWLAEDVSRIVHAHSRAGTLVAWWLARAGERRVLASLHCYGKHRWFYRRVYSVLGDRLYFLSPAMRAYYGLPEAGWKQCIPPCVAAPENVPSRVPVRGERLRLGGVGALVRWKRWDLVLSALARLAPEERRQLHFDHIGGSLMDTDSQRFAAELYELTEREGLSDTVTWHGVQPTSRALLDRIDALVVASDHEPFSVALLEALMHGVPVLAADSGGSRDIITPPRNGWLFRSGDAADLTARLRTLLSSDGLRAVQIDQAGLKRFTAAAVATQWLQVYEALVRR